MRRAEQPAALDHLRVIELPGVAGGYAGKLLADLGADVIKVEPPEGDPGRFTGPFAGDLPDPERSLPFINFNTNKRSVILDLENEEGRAQLRRLAATADLIIESYQPGRLAAMGLGYDDLRGLNPGIVLTSITTFGQNGPYSAYAGGDLVGAAMSGLLTVQGDPDRPPANAPLEQGYQLSGIHAAIASLYVLYQRAATGRGDHIDISIQEVLGHMNFPMARYDLDADIAPRPGAQGVQAGQNAYPVQDGWVHIYGRRWDRLVEWLKVEALRDPRWNDRAYREAHWEEADRLIGAVTSQMTKQQATTEGQRTGNPTAPISSTEDFVKSPHTQERAFFVEQQHPVLGAIRLAGKPYALSETPWRLRRPAPRLGEHTAEVLTDLSPASLQEAFPSLGGKGQDEAEPVPTLSGNSTNPSSLPLPSEGRGRSALQGGPGDRSVLPFKGIRVLDFTIAFAGPFATRYLAELGAEVIKVESSAAETETSNFRRTNPGNRGALMMEINRSKRSITLDLHRPEAQELARRLAAISDIAIGNFRPGTLARWNLGYEQLRAANPAIIMAEMPGFGSEGPHASYISLGQTLTAYSGIMRLWGHPESPENRRSKLAYPDWIGAGKAALAILAALHYRERTGRGQYIEVAQVEGAAAMAGVAYLDYFLNGRVAEPAGNRHPTFAPHNVYPCRGQDRWVAIAVTSEDQWAALCRAIGASDWLADEGLATAAGRKGREVELDERIGQWSRQHTPHQAMRLLQRAGVPAGAVQNGEDLYLDPHLRERGYTVTVEQPFLGRVTQPGLTMRFQETPEQTPRGAPVLGEGNDYVFGELLGLSAAERERLTAEKVLV